MEDEEPQRSSKLDRILDSWAEDPPTWLILIGLVLSPIGLFAWYVGGIGVLLSHYYVLNFYNLFEFPPFFLDWLFSDWVIGQFDRFELQTTPEGIGFYQEDHPANFWNVVLCVLTSFIIIGIGTLILGPCRYLLAYYNRRVEGLL